MTLDTNILIYILLIILIINILWLIRLELRLNKIFIGKKANDLESVILNTQKDLKELSVAKDEITKYLETVEQRLKHSTQGVATIRFNPFKGSGGNQSFATAFLNEDGDGVVISSLYSRDRVSIFAKPIEKKTSTHELSKEEKSAIKEASSKIKIS